MSGQSLLTQTNGALAMITSTVQTGTERVVHHGRIFKLL